MPQITVNKTLAIAVPEDKTLYQVLNKEGIYLPSGCGGRGQCGLCRLQVKGAASVSAAEKEHLNAAELEQNWHLACQVDANRDLDITLSEEQLKAKSVMATVENLRNLTHDIKEVTLKLDEKLNFKPGQFMLMRIPIYNGAASSEFRSYSIAIPPNAKNQVQFEVRLVRNGYATTYIHQHLAVGDRLLLAGPYGQFYLRDSQKDILMIAGGSGMAPIKAILEAMAAEKNPRRTRFFFGGRDRADLFLLDEMKELEKTLPNFSFIPVVGQTDSLWQGEVGMVPEVASRFLQAGEVKRTEAYLCGSPGMINACLAALEKKGLGPEAIFYDKF